MAYAFLQVTREGLPLFGKNGSFFDVILSGYIRMFTGNSLIVTVTSIVLVIFYLLFFVSQRILVFNQPYTTVLLSTLFITMFLSALFKRPLPAERVLLPLWPLLALSLIEVYEVFASLAQQRRYKFSPGILSLIIAVGLFINFFSQVNLTKTTDFESDYPVRAAIYAKTIRTGKPSYIKHSPVEQFYIEKIGYELMDQTNP